MSYTFDENDPSWELLSRRWIRRTLREVYRHPDGVVLKRYVHHRGLRDWRPSWAREASALR